MLTVESKSSVVRSSTSCPLPLESGEFMHSGVFPGFCLPVALLWTCDTAKAMEASTGRELLNSNTPESSVKGDLRLRL